MPTVAEQARSAHPSIRRDVAVRGSDGTSVSCDVYEPTADTRSDWSLVVCPGFGSVKTLMHNWGESLAKSGHLTFVVGYRGYGEAPGQLGRIFPEEHVADVQLVVRSLATNPAVSNRVGLLGVSYGGAVALQVAALEEDVGAVISIVGYGSGSRHLRSLRRYGEWMDLLDRLEADREERRHGRESAAISLDEILLRDREAQVWRERVEAEHPTMRFDVTMESVEHLLDFEPQQFLPFSRRLPLLVIHAERDRVVPIDEAHSVFDLAEGPKQLVILPGAEHHDVHSGEAFDSCLEAVGAFLSNLD